MEEINMVGICTVLCPKNIRVFSDENTDLDISAGNPQVITERQLRSLGIRAGLFDGRLRVLKGHVEFALKDSNIIIDGAEPDGNIFITIVGPDQSEWEKNFLTDSTIKKKDGIAKNITAAAPVEEKKTAIPVAKETVATKVQKLFTKKSKKKG